MKSCLLLPLCLLFFVSGARAQSWTWQNPLPQGNTLRAVHFVDAQHGWAVGEAGTVVHTADGGATWEMQSSGTRLALSDVHFVDAQAGWAVGADNFSGLILHTADGGATWTTQQSGTDILRAVHFVDTQTGWAAGNRTILHTTDGGATWTTQQTGTDPGMTSLTDVFFVDAQTGWVVGYSGMILHTTDGGATWTPQASGLDPNSSSAILNAVHFVDAQTGWAVSNTVLHTTDGGATWTEQEADRATFTDVYFTDADHGWIATNQASAFGTAIGVTTDGGATWTSVATGATSDLFGVHFDDADTGWLIGSFGEVLHTTDGGTTWAAQTSGPHDTFWDVAFVNADTGLVVGPGDFALVTEDGGQRWEYSFYEAAGTSASKNTRRHVEEGASDEEGAAEDLEEVCKEILHRIKDNAANDRDLFLSVFCVQVYYLSKSSSKAEPEDAPHLVAPQSDAAAYGLVVHVAENLSRLVAPHRQQKFDLTWSRKEYGSLEELHTGTFADSLNGWAAGTNGTILHSTDSGDTWNPQNSGTTSLLYNVFFMDSDEGWVVGEGGTILHTTDGGQTWTPQSSGTAQDLQTVLFLDDERGWAAGEGRTLLRTTDGGQTWTPQPVTSPFATFYDMAFTDAMNGWIVGGLGTILHTTDGGQTWTLAPSGTTNALLGINFVDGENGWISGEGGTILRFTGSNTSTAVEDEPGEAPSDFVLSQNYPNPFNPATTIHFTVAQQSHVQLQIFDVLGRLVETLLDEPRSAGSYTAVWEAASAPSGVYLYRLQTGSRIETKRMVLLR